MKLSLVLCVLLAVVLSVRAAVSNNVEAFTTTVAITTVPITGLYNDTTAPPTTTTTMPPTVTATPPISSPSTTTPVPTTQAPLSPSQIMCAKGWELFKGRCYMFVNNAMSWSRAQEYGFLQQLTNNNGYSEAWLGGFYLQDQWLWLDGSWFYNNTWASQSEDSSNPCLVLNSNEGTSNYQCNYYFLSICVKNSNVPLFMVCPNGWMGFQGRCYYHNTDILNWHYADANCASLGANLVSVHSLEEYNFLYQQIAILNGYTWLGGFCWKEQLPM
ncbi:Type-2 ice-structuring protein [Dissostichus eleginoides]|uniref:Type-2 ice-structuring protein n=1 Tax=Dissostichus eleginoides TaxID=100907 RepID=A0AAD9BRG7_DISEL|nr:Type-2 ice-structuring protein [Dissostichus eleginoides]